MRSVLVIGSAIAGLGILLAGFGSPASDAGTASYLSATAGGARSAAMRRPRSSSAPTPSPCSTNYPTTSFNGVHNVSDHAGGLASGVLAGASNDACASWSGIGAGTFNGIGQNGYESFISGGVSNGIIASSSFVRAGISNTAGNTFSIGAAFVGAGFYNWAEGEGSFVGAGDTIYDGAQQNAQNPAPPDGNVAYALDSFVGSGDLNYVSGEGSFIGAGGSTFAQSGSTSPANRVSGTDSFLGAGDQNAVAANEAFVGGGNSNSIASGATYAFIGAGEQNGVTANDAVVAGGLGSKASGAAAAVGGGQGNLASGSSATVPGGYHNTASGSGSFAAGYVAEAISDGSFVWSDESSTTVHVRSSANNQFVARASGGYELYSNPALTTGVRLAPGSGTWGSVSDRALKTRVVPIDDANVLARVAKLPVSEWSYVSERGVRHMGPMAQDFYAAFGVGEDDRHITSIDEDGVALAAIKALHAENAELRARLAVDEAKRAREAAWRSRADTRFALLEAKLEAIAAHPTTGGARHRKHGYVIGFKGSN